MTNEQRLREIEARASAATPGPWQRDGGYILSKSETVGFLTVGPRDMGVPRADGGGAGAFRLQQRRLNVACGTSAGRHPGLSGVVLPD